MQNRVLECRTKNVSVLVPRDWMPDEPTVRTLAYISQMVLSGLHLNIGRATVLFVEDASAGVDNIVLRTEKTSRNCSALVLVHPKMRSLVVSVRSDDNIAGVVAGGAAITRYNFIHPKAAELEEVNIYESAYENALKLIHSARAKRRVSE